MKATEQKRPGRPLIGDERMQVAQIMVPPSLRRAAEKQANETGQSMSDVYREWMEKGRK
jgi:hypothetical protein